MSAETVGAVEVGRCDVGAGSALVAVIGPKYTAYFKKIIAATGGPKAEPDLDWMRQGFAKEPA